MDKMTVKDVMCTSCEVLLSLSLLLGVSIGAILVNIVGGTKIPVEFLYLLMGWIVVAMVYNLWKVTRK